MYQTDLLCADPSAALRSRSPEMLAASLRECLIWADEPAQVDQRDVLVAFAPFYDCAQRLGLDPVRLFDEASTDARPHVRKLAGSFARRRDVSLDVFGWKMTTTADGPCYGRVP